MGNRATTQEEVEKKVEEWHEKTDIKVEIHEYLGWTKTEWNKYLETHEIPRGDLRPIND